MFVILTMFEIKKNINLLLTVHIKYFIIFISNKKKLELEFDVFDNNNSGCVVGLCACVSACL